RAVPRPGARRSRQPDEPRVPRRLRAAAQGARRRRRAGLSGRPASRAEPPGAFVFRSAGRTHEGRVRRLNEDGFVESSRLGLWAVADGMGGHAAGEVASRKVVESLAALPAPASGFGFVRDVTEALKAANAELIAYAADRGADAVGSTVVVLLAVDGHYACLWAGDSR